MNFKEYITEGLNDLDTVTLEKIKVLKKEQNQIQRRLDEITKEIEELKKGSPEKIITKKVINLYNRNRNDQIVGSTPTKEFEKLCKKFNLTWKELRSELYAVTGKQKDIDEAIKAGL